MFEEFLQSDWLTDHQAFVAALIGIGGLISGYLVNAEITRKRDDYIVKQQVRSISALLGAEIGALSKQGRLIIQILEEFKHLYADWNKDGAKPVKLEKISYSGHLYFEKMIEKIALLEPTLVYRITDFYHLYFDVMKGVDDFATKDMTPQMMQFCDSLIAGLTIVVSKGTPLSIVLRPKEVVVDSLEM